MLQKFEKNNSEGWQSYAVVSLLLFYFALLQIAFPFWFILSFQMSDEQHPAGF